jgi:5'-nucleotidase
VKKYEWVLFDADETLFHFDSYRGLKIMFSQFGVEFTKRHYNKYQTINAALWIDYQNKKISSQQLQLQRFEKWANKLNVPSAELNKAFQDAMADICAPLDGAVELIHSLKDQTKLGIITNGFTDLQHARLNRTGLKEHFEILVISEQVGVAKPNIEIFEHALSMMGNPERKKVLMVGDTLESDILGGLNAGLDTCWFNSNNKSIHKRIKPHFEVTSLNQLQNLLIKT